MVRLFFKNIKVAGKHVFIMVSIVSHVFCCLMGGHKWVKRLNSRHYTCIHCGKQVRSYKVDQEQE